MIALCQLTFAAIGAWVVLAAERHGSSRAASRCGSSSAGSRPGLVGILVGLPALRLRGVNLAVVTLGFAAAARRDARCRSSSPEPTDGVRVQRPELFSSDRMYLLLTARSCSPCARLIVFFLQRSRWGSSWKAVAFSERGTRRRPARACASRSSPRSP